METFSIPNGMNEKEVLEAIEIVANGLSSQFKFSYYTIEDIKQEARIEALGALDKFDPSKGNKLHTFLWIHVWNRLYNLRRNKYDRNDMPCLNCPLKAYDPNYNKSNSGCTEFDDKADCPAYNRWLKRNSSKHNIMSPVHIDCIIDERERNMSTCSNIINSIHTKEIIEKIDRGIPNNMRILWIKLKNDVKMSKSNKEKLIEIIHRILNGEDLGA